MTLSDLRIQIQTKILYDFRFNPNIVVMPEINPRNATQTWKYALIGGLASIPLTAGLHWLSGIENDMFVNMIIFGGLLAGFLAEVRQIDGKSVGFRAGVVGGLPILWFVFEALRFVVTGPAGPIRFRIGAVVMIVGFTIASLFLSGGVGFVGAKIGRWLAKKTDTQRPPIAIN
jgi:hypothetical protein